MFKCSKRFGPFPCAHRNHYHKGHCAYVHGYAIEFVCEFESDFLNEAGFVTDFGRLAEVRDYLFEMYDHKIVLSHADPELPAFEELERRGLMKITKLNTVSMEWRARDLFSRCQMLDLPIVSVHVKENENNAGAYNESR